MVLILTTLSFRTFFPLFSVNREKKLTILLNLNPEMGLLLLFQNIRKRSVFFLF